MTAPAPQASTRRRKRSKRSTQRPSRRPLPNDANYEQPYPCGYQGIGEEVGVKVLRYSDRA